MSADTDRVAQTTLLRAQLAAIAGNEPASSYIEVRPIDPAGRQVFVPVRSLDIAVERILTLAPRHNVYIGACPRTQRNGKLSALERAWVVWADIDTPEAFDRLCRFQPVPSIVINTGSGNEHVHAWWALAEPIPAEWAKLANLRLAHALSADKNSTDSARVLRPAGTLNHKHDPPRPVRCLWSTPDTFTLRDVVGWLPDPPSPPPPGKPELSVVYGGAYRPIDGLVQTVRNAAVGNRNSALFWAACRLFAQKSTEGDVEALRAAALAVGLGEAEIERTLRSARERGRAA